MKKFDEWYFPDGEDHLIDQMSVVKPKPIDGRLTYQYHKYEESMKWVTQRRVAIDVGAHIGLWSFFLARDFRDVACFEPVQEHRDCWHKNIHAKNAELFECALGFEKKMVSMHTNPTSSGDTFIDLGVTGEVEMRTLDSFNFSDVDYIKIDCEGYELNVLRGAAQTLLRCKPCVVVEQKGDMHEKFGAKRLGAVSFLEKLGAKRRADISGDYILSWE